MRQDGESGMDSVNISPLAFRSLGIFIALSFIVDLLIFDAIGEEVRTFFLAVSISKYLVPLAAWWVIGLIQRRIVKSLE